MVHLFTIFQIAKNSAETYHQFISNKNTMNNLSSVNHNLILVTDLLVHKEFSDVRTLVSGKLENFTKLGINQHTTVALEGLLQRFGNLSNIEIIGEALNSGDALTTISLLNADVDFGVVLTSVAGEGI